ncbi:autotransporter outer membrane beta-barrel domain-containing protein [Pseudomonas arsenicoxydans]|uniref:Autotransporter outer membrane beta-barrel domain-containing protein n=1 Tax=Pseudomonas arsenicoxydans TaxID=702115 RepID=A0A4P6GF94_9PSED|nr:autotransporter outer membrane beta-barrel domain-containing protein [Pseudomonas arsenicoxydans]
MLSTPVANAKTLDPGESATVTNPPDPEAWSVSQKGILTIINANALSITSQNASVIFDGGQSERIEARDSSVLSLTGATVNSSTGRGAVSLSDSSAIIDNGTITSTNSVGLLLGRNVNTPTSSSATVKGGSTITGLPGGANAVGFAVLNVENSTILGTGATSYGVQLGGATLSATGSTLSGGQNGLQIITDTIGVNASSVTLKDTLVKGGSGSAIVLGSSGAAGSVAGINILGSTKLIGGNGTALQATNRSTANVKVDGSALRGNVIADTGSTIALTMQNAASIDGDLQNVTQVSLDSGSTLNGNVQAVAGTAAAVNLNNNSAINGNVDNVVSLEMNNGSRITGDVHSDANGSVSLDNRSVLNGNVGNVSSLKLTNGSSMSGDASTGNNGSVLLDSGSVLTGQIKNSGNVSINNAAQWVMTENSTLPNLTSSNGIVRMGGNEQFLRLNVAKFSGDSTVFIGTDFATGNTDFFEAARADGHLKFDVSATGNKPLTAEDVHIGNIASGNADVRLNNLGEKVDAGAYVFRLAREGEGLYLRPDRKTVSTSSNTVLALAGSARSVLYGEGNELSSELGDRSMSLRSEASLRAMDDDSVKLSNSVWVRTYSNQYSVNNAYGDGYTQNQAGMTVGADTLVDLGGRAWVLGAFIGRSHTNLDLKFGSTSTVDSFNTGFYGSTFDARSGVFVSAMVKFNRFDNKAKVIMSDYSPAEGNYTALGASGSVAVGKHIGLEKGYFFEPQVELSTAAVKSDTYQLDNGLEAKVDTMRSVQGKVGVRGGRVIPLDKGGSLVPTLSLAANHEFVKTNKVKINGDDFDDDGGSSAVEYGAGLKWTPAQRNWQVSGQAGGSTGATVKQDWSGSLRISYFF